MPQPGSSFRLALLLALLIPFAGAGVRAQSTTSTTSAYHIVEDGEHRYLSGRVIVKLTPAGYQFGSPLTIPALLDALADVPGLRAKQMFPETPASRRRRREAPPSVDLRPIFALDFEPGYSVNAVLRKLRPALAAGDDDLFDSNGIRFIIGGLRRRGQGACQADGGEGDKTGAGHETRPGDGQS